MTTDLDIDRQANLPLLVMQQLSLASIDMSAAANFMLVSLTQYFSDTGRYVRHPPHRQI